MSAIKRRRPPHLVPPEAASRGPARGRASTSQGRTTDQGRTKHQEPRTKDQRVQMHIVILSARAGWHTGELCRALAERRHSGRVLPYEGLVARLGTGGAGGLSIGSTAIFDADAVLARIVPHGSLEQIIYRVDALHWIEDCGVTVMNTARAIERSVDKFYTTALLREAGLPVPETIVCERFADALAACRTMLAAGGPGLGEGGGADVIIKPLFGSMGHGMVRVSD